MAIFPCADETLGTYIQTSDCQILPIVSVVKPEDILVYRGINVEISLHHNIITGHNGRRRNENANTNPRDEARTGIHKDDIRL